MHWILIIGLNLSANAAMGAFETEEQCWKAADRFTDLFQGQSTIATCINKNSPMGALIK